MVEFVKMYPYLFGNVCTTTFLVVVGWFALTRRQWKAMVLSGLANVPIFPFLVLYEGEYWSPVRFGGFALGIEDVLCSFAVAGMVWFVVGLVFRDRILFELRWKKILIRYAVLGSVSTVVFVVLYFLRLSGMASLVYTCLIVTFILLVIRRSLWPLALVGLVGFSLFYLVLVKIYFLIWPDFVYQWNLAISWCRLIFGLPLGEIIFSVTYGAFWPLFMVFVTNAQLIRRGIRPA